MHARVVVLAVAASFVAGCSEERAGAPEDSTWSGVLQFGTPLDDHPFGVALDALGNVFVAGATIGEGYVSRAGFLAKYDAAGRELWSRQLTGEARGVAVDPTGNAVVAVQASGFPAVELVKYDPSGAQLWMETSDTSPFWCHLSLSGVSGVTTGPAGEILVVGGYTRGADNNGCIAKLDRDGNPQWHSIFGTSDGTSDLLDAIALDASGDVFVVGSTGLPWSSSDAILARYDAAGPSATSSNQEWVRQLGTDRDDRASGVAVDERGDILVVGFTDGDLGGVSLGSRDVFVARYDPAGDQVWLRQLGTSADDVASAVAIDGSGDVLVVGSTRGGLARPSADGLADAFIAKLDASGNLLWVRQLGAAGEDLGDGIAVDANGFAFVVGATAGELGGPNRGLRDAFVAKYGPDGTLW